MDGNENETERLALERGEHGVNTKNTKLDRWENSIIKESKRLRAPQPSRSSVPPVIGRKSEGHEQRHAR